MALAQAPSLWRMAWAPCLTRIQALSHAPLMMSMTIRVPKKKGPRKLSVLADLDEELLDEASLVEAVQLPAWAPPLRLEPWSFFPTHMQHFD